MAGGPTEGPLLPFNQSPCALLSLPDACVSPCFPLLQECEAARLLVAALLQQPLLQPQQLVLKNFRQKEEEGEEQQRRLDSPYELLTQIVHAAEANPPPSNAI